MARFGREAGERGTLDTRTTRRGVMQGFFLPKDTPSAGTEAAERLAAGVKLIEVNPSRGRLTIYPTDTRSWSDDFLGPKYAKITTIVLSADVDPDWELSEILEDLPSGFTKDYEYGLGLAQECEVLVSLIQDATDCSVIEFVAGGPTEVVRDRLRISFARFDALRAELARIKNRGDLGIRRVKETHVHNELAGVFGLEPRKLTLGRLPTSKWMTKVAAGEVPLNDDEQNELVSAAAVGARSIAASNPQKLARLQRDIELVNLDQLIAAYAAALDAGHPEPWWQRFFEENIFLLQLIFGGPTVFIDSQLAIGEGDNSPKGKKIADYLFKNSITNNAALVEIKKPGTRLLGRREYRAGVFGVDAEIGKAVTQVLDQALQLARSEADTRLRSGDATWSITAPRCFVVAGLASELDTADKNKSFDLYREHLAGIRLVTFDEIFEQLRTLRGFLGSETAE